VGAGGFDDGLNFGGGTPPVEPPPAPPSTATPPVHTPDDDLDFAGTPQPPDVPPDPNGENWRGQPGPVGPTGPQGPPGADGEDGAGGAVVLPTPPIADPGALWWDNIGGQLYVRYDDGNGPPQWVAASSKAGGTSIPEPPNDGTIYGRGGTTLGWAGVLPLAGGTLTGDLALAADPDQPMEATTKHYVDAQIDMVAGTAGVYGLYNARTNTQAAADPAHGNLTWNTAGQANATQIYVSIMSSRGNDVSSIWTGIVPPQTLVLQRQDLSSQNQVFTITGVTSNSTWMTLAVTPVTNIGPLFSNNNDLLVILPPPSASQFLPLTGGTMTGPIVLAGNASAALNPVPLQQMQAAISAIPAGGVTSFNTRTGAITLTNADVVTVLPPSSTAPVMDGTAAIGSINTWAKADHIHPIDTSRYAATNPAGYQTAAQVTAAIDAKLVIAATAPAVVHGALWWDSTGGQLYIGYNDGNSLAWIVASSTPR
jgi:hypothetical protein